MSVNGTFYFDPEDRIYADHFPGRAVVPGILIVHAFLEEAGKAGELGSGCCLVEKFGFKEFVAPGAYSFSIETRAESLLCKLYHEGRTVVKGFLKRQP
jgi:3-hydroxyacyl-[acyl-carrier-protein] dehydratase